MWPRAKVIPVRHSRALSPFGLFLVSALFFCLANWAQAEIFYSCTPQYCAAYGKCPDFKCKGKDKIVLTNVTTCGCCNRCVEQLDENEECQLDMSGNIPGIQCGPHLRCHKNKKGLALCTKINKIETDGCEYQRLKLEENPSQIAISIPLPECDEFGDYEAKQCKQGTLCQCVDKVGKPIFGSEIYHKASKMNCLCSRQFVNINAKLREFGSKPLKPINFIRCKSNGNFEPFQYYGNYSYCINETAGVLDDRPVLKEHSSDLPCYQYRYKYKSDCIKAYNLAIEDYTELTEKGLTVVGFDLPNCDLDGSFAPVQCFNSQCYCVNKKGEKLRSTSVNRDDHYFAQDQQCTCARHMEMIRDITKRDKVTELYSRYQCDKNGNYLPLQCSNSACYCVNPFTGYVDNSQSPSMALKTEHDVIRKLFCYVNYPEQDRLNRAFNLV